VKGNAMTRTSNFRAVTGTAAALTLIAVGIAGQAHAKPSGDVILSMNDGHTVLDHKGKMVGAEHPVPDSIALIGVAGDRARVLASVAVPGNVEGPPTAAWISPDARWGIITSGTKIDPANPAALAHNNVVSVLSFDAGAPHVVNQVAAGEGATGVAVTPDQMMLLVADRFSGTVSVFAIHQRALQPVGKVDLGAKSTPTSIVILKDGKTALVGRHGNDDLAVLHIDGEHVSFDGTSIPVGHFPVTMDYNAATNTAAVGNMGKGKGEIDSVSVIDVAAVPYRVRATFPVGIGPEPLKFSPDGRFLAVGSVNGSNKPDSSFYHKDGYLQIFAMQDGAPYKVTDIAVGAWPQGIGFSRSGREILVQNMTDRTISVLHWNAAYTQLTPSILLKVDAGPASMATPW